MKIDLFPGREDDALLLLLGALAVLYVGTGEGRWGEAKWQRAGGGLAAALALTKVGKMSGEQAGFDKGFTTYNPDLHVDELVAKALGKRSDTALGGAVRGLARGAVGYGLDQLQERIAPPVAATTEQLPPGWTRDETGALRDEHGRYASEQALASYRQEQ